MLCGRVLHRLRVPFPPPAEVNLAASAALIDNGCATTLRALLSTPKQNTINGMLSVARCPRDEVPHGDGAEKTKSNPQVKSKKGEQKGTFKENPNNLDGKEKHKQEQFYT